MKPVKKGERVFEDSFFLCSTWCLFLSPVHRRMENRRSIFKIVLFWCLSFSKLHLPVFRLFLCNQVFVCFSKIQFL